jgi:hypothetical protein
MHLFDNRNVGGNVVVTVFVKSSIQFVSKPVVHCQNFVLNRQSHEIFDLWFFS